MLKTENSLKDICFGFLVVTVACFSAISCQNRNSNSDARRQAIASEIDSVLNDQYDLWYPRVIDNEHGGFLSNYSHDWQPVGSQNKMIVTQARHLWSLSKIEKKYPGKSRYADYASQGFEFLRNKMWDDAYGGFYQLVTREGEVISNQQDEIRKTLYGNAFAIYGLAAYYEFSKDSAALNLAKQTFTWLDNHSYDSVNGGYFQPLDRDGTPVKTGYPKDYNSGIHILEALTELYTVWPDELLQERLRETFLLVRDTMITDRGYLNLYFQADWTHLSYRDSSEATLKANMGRDHITPGHDIETAFLLLEAAHVLGLEKDETTMRIAKRMVDHTLETGWDSEVGGLYDAGYYFKGDNQITITKDTKNWWAQAEALHSLLIMAEHYPKDSHGYFDKFARQWEYIKAYLLDPEHGGWYDSGLDKSPERKTALKSQIWKGNYHTVRALLECLERLEGKRRMVKSRV